jgi:membrane-associated phospholipid phosphatase
MTPFEWIALVYFVAQPLSAARYASLRGWLYAAGAILLVIVARFTMPWEARAWVPHAYLVLGYWIPAAFTPGINRTFELWLARADDRLRSGKLGAGSWRSGHLLELAYLLCYPMVPAAFTVVFVLGDREAMTRFWNAVLLAGYASYVSLPWTAARPPRLRDDRDTHVFPEESAVRSINRHVLGRVSHNLNTFPSGHVAVAIAAALVVCSVSIPWGLVFVATAGAIAVAAVTGRYHYLVDVLVGAGVGVGAALIAAAVLRFVAVPGRDYPGA